MQLLFQNLQQNKNKNSALQKSESLQLMLCSNPTSQQIYLITRHYIAQILMPTLRDICTHLSLLEFIVTQFFKLEHSHELSAFFSLDIAIILEIDFQVSNTSYSTNSTYTSTNTKC